MDQLLNLSVASLQTMITSLGTILTPTFSMAISEELRILPPILPLVIDDIRRVLDMQGSGWLVGMG